MNNIHIAVKSFDELATRFPHSLSTESGSMNNYFFSITIVIDNTLIKISKY